MGSAAVGVAIATAGNGSGRSGATCAETAVAAASPSAALQKSRCTILFIMGDDAIKFRMARQPASPSPNQTLLLELDAAEHSL
jgi:hypothetical protein